MDVGCDDSEDYCGSALQVVEDDGGEEARLAKGTYGTRTGLACDY